VLIDAMQDNLSCVVITINALDNVHSTTIQPSQKQRWAKHVVSLYKMSEKSTDNNKN